MDETASVSCLAVADHRPPQKPGGCVGIFFHLFDWNRRFAKKKLFSKKLLPPARTVHASTKFGADEKMPKSKPHLISGGDNNGGYQKKNGNKSLTELQKKQEMRPPSLVAKLMGLDSMPATVHRDKLKKKPSVDLTSGFGLEKVSTKVESRPQKLQKTDGQLDRKAVIRFGVEALQIRNVLLSRSSSSSSSSRKHNNSAKKLANPVKSPKLISPAARHASRTSRLIDAATRILEPGLQATHRAKSAIAYSKSMHLDSGNYDEVLKMGQPAKGQHQQGNVVSYGGVGGQASCRNCGSVVESEPHLAVKEPLNYRAPLASHFATSCHGSLVNNLMSDAAAYTKRKQGSEAEMQDKARACSEVGADRKAMPHEFGGAQGLSGFRLGCHQREETSSALKHRSQAQKRMSIGSDGLMPMSNFSSNIGSSRSKYFVGTNRSLGGRSRLRVSNRMDNPILNMESKFCNRRDDGLPPLRHKRRMDSVNAQLQSSGVGNSTMAVRRRNINFEALGGSGKELGINSSFVKTRSDSQGGVNQSNTSGATSFTFSSPSKLKTGRLDESRNQNNKHISYQRTQIIDECQGKRFVQKQELPRRDALGCLLQEKLKELIFQGEIEGGNGQPVRTTAMILQELISALTIEQLTSPPSSYPNVNTPFQNVRKIEGSSIGFSHDSDYLSPGSVLDASFSNESCFSSSLDDNSVCRLHPDLVNSSHNNYHWDSVTTTSEGRTFPKLVTDMLDHIYRILQSITLAGGCQLTSRELCHAKETILTAELLFGSATRHNIDRTRNSVLGTFLLDELNVVAVSTGPDGNYISSLEGSNDRDQLRRLRFDCVIEWVDSRYRKYCDSGCRTWRQLLPLQWCTGLVIEEVRDEVKRWTNMAGMIPDEIVELEIGQSLGKWTEFETESYETGREIGQDIIEALLDETVRDLWVL